MTVKIYNKRLEEVEANTLLVAVDGRMCLPSASARSAIRAAHTDEPLEAMEYYEERMLEAKPIPDGSASRIHVNDHWKYLLVAAALYHVMDGHRPSESDNANLLERALHSAMIAAPEGSTVAVGLIGTSRMPKSVVAGIMERVLGTHQRVDIRLCIPEA